uniref:Uncharacterized protein n=1 Tax=Rhizophora mucronata TaxID=61149 RepID=A0A2P2N0D5_RHIMU
MYGIEHLGLLVLRKASTDSLCRVSLKERIWIICCAFTCIISIEN